MALIEADNVTKVYNPNRPDALRALNDVSLRVERSEFVVLRGPSGSGKTTLISIIGCMSRPTSGRVALDGRDVAKLPEHFLAEIRRERFGFVFQQFHLIRNLSVRENVLLPLYPTRVGLAAMKKRVEAVLERFGIADKRNFKIRQLSGGEQQRVAIARALINEPDVIVADEPTAHLDTELSIEFLDTLAELNRQGRTVIVATHDPLVYGHPQVKRTFTMRGGRIEGMESP